MSDIRHFRVAYEFIIEDEAGEKLPPMWTPVTTFSKAAAVEVLFPRKVESIGYVPEKLPPPQVMKFIRLSVVGGRRSLSSNSLMIPPPLPPLHVTLAGQTDSPVRKRS